MVAQMGQEERAAYEIGHLPPHILKLHQCAWLDADQDGSTGLCANLSRMADGLVIMQQRAPAALARDTKGNWRECFLSPEHLAWSAAGEVACRLTGTTPTMPLAASNADRNSLAEWSRQVLGLLQARQCDPAVQSVYQAIPGICLGEGSV
jgi:hypothetical protein